MKSFNILLVCLLLSSCAGVYHGEVKDEFKGKTYICEKKDTGDLISFNTNTIRDAFVRNGSIVRMTVTDSNGNEVEITNENTDLKNCYLKKPKPKYNSPAMVA